MQDYLDISETSLRFRVHTHKRDPQCMLTSLLTFINTFGSGQYEITEGVCWVCHAPEVCVSILELRERMHGITSFSNTITT